MKTSFVTKSHEQTKVLAQQIGERLKGGEVFEFVSDLGGGKTTFTKGLVKGFGSSDDVSSPTFTISFTYKRADGKQLHHFDFYRLQDPGIVRNELEEVVDGVDDVVVVEWGDVVEDVLPTSCIKVNIKNVGESEREIQFNLPDENHYLLEGLKL